MKEELYEITIKLKFKQGDKVKILYGNINIKSIIVGFEYSFSLVMGEHIVLYKVQNKKINSYGWFREDQLELVERK